jgi:F0F1-type ATP synthase membrane subunit b/b'
LAALQHDLKLVLQLEEEGQRRLAEAQDEARRLFEGRREEARRILEEGERSLARQRMARTAEVEADISAGIKDLERHFRAAQDDLRRRAERHREAAVERIIGWLLGE